MSGSENGVQPAAARRLLRDTLERSLRSDFPEVNRLSYAHTSVSFRVQGDGERVVALLDQTPPRVADNGAPAEIDIEFGPGQADRFAQPPDPPDGANDANRHVDEKHPPPRDRGQQSADHGSE